jgi:hypothetical protein
MGCSLSRFKRSIPAQITVQGDDDHRTLNGTHQKRSSSAWSRFFSGSSHTAPPPIDGDTDNLNQQRHDPQSTSAADIHSSSIRAEDASHDHDPSEVSGVAVQPLLATFLVSTITDHSLVHFSTQINTTQPYSCPLHQSRFRARSVNLPLSFLPLAYPIMHSIVQARPSAAAPTLSSRRPSTSIPANTMPARSSTRN